MLNMDVGSTAENSEMGEIGALTCVSLERSQSVESTGGHAVGKVAGSLDSFFREVSR